MRYDLFAAFQKGRSARWDIGTAFSHKAATLRILAFLDSQGGDLDHDGGDFVRVDFNDRLPKAANVCAQSDAGNTTQLTTIRENHLGAIG
ncbi:hypothetical protein ALO39_200038 [Pseudomonas syringae pv. lapsa]|nr:hypothetical protein ALO39_200038 [Pseudomonas syringae pv. lapsa]